MVSETLQLEELLPEVTEISEKDLQEAVVDCWEMSLEKSEFNTYSQLEFGPGYEQIGQQNQLKHVREVTQCAMALTDTLVQSRDVAINRDYVIAGSLLHDISKFYEKSPHFDGYTELGELIPHPHFAIHVLEQQGVPLEVQHIALIHTSGSKPQPKTLEAMIVMLADIASANSIWWHTANELLHEIHTKNVQS
jgi:putative nucleotidyltransferase with HDIG domain